jgi:hypothetical protein
MLVISPSEIKVTHNNITYDLIGTPSLEFSFTYLYYEPEIGHVRKVVKVNDELVYQHLTEDEVKLIQEFLSKLDDDNYLENFLKQYKKIPEKFDPTPQLKHAVNDKGHYVGLQVLPQPNLIEAPSFHPKDTYLESFGISYHWDQINSTWVINGNYKEKRKLEYLRSIGIGDQLGALFNAIEALSKGDALPEDFNSILSTIKKIKEDIPKE